MDLREVICFRIPQFIQTHIKGHFQQRVKRAPLALNESFKGPLYNAEEVQHLFRTFPFHGTYKVFTEEIDILNFNDWRKDVSTGIVSPIAYYGRIAKQDYNKNGDVKFVSEVSRMEFLPFIALKYVESGEERYLTRVEEIITGWSKQNPYLYSINWTSGIEVGIRTTNLIYTHYILNHFQVLSAWADRLIVEIISDSYQFLKNHLSLYSSANNHLMAELMGLMVIGSYFKINGRELGKWKTMFFEQIEKQTNDDGVNMELCTRYHAEVCDQILVGLTFLKSAHHNIPEQIWQKLENTFQFTQHVDYLGNETIFGDNDEGSVINPFFHNHFSLYKSQLQTSNFLFQTKYRSNGLVDFRNYLIFGSEFSVETYDLPEKDTLFKDSGYCFLYDHNSKTKLSFDCGPIGDNVSAAHGHSDIFHFNLEVGGMPFIVDSGTYQYHSEYGEWRNYFKGITAHNTISINNKNHALNNGRMSWINRPRTQVKEVSLNDIESFCRATTNAFKAEKIVLSREVKFQKSQNRVMVKDFVETENDSSYELFFYLHFHPNTSIEHKGISVELKRENRKVSITNDYFKDAQILYGREHPPIGWFSKEFNKKEKTSCLKFSVNGHGKCEIETTILYD
ncbi:MAG: alginate lyase family protein [Allomuricauda sp.]